MCGRVFYVVHLQWSLACQNWKSSSFNPLLGNSGFARINSIPVGGYRQVLQSSPTTKAGRHSEANQKSL